MSDTQVLTADQMRAAEQALFDSGITVASLMEIAAGGAAEWVRRIAAGRNVTVLCGPGNNGGDGYVIARLLRQAGLRVQVVAPMEPASDAAKKARSLWGGTVLTSGGDADGEVFVDCLFGSGISRPLSAAHSLLLRDLAERHSIKVAIDLPSGIDSDTGETLAERLPHFDVTFALGAWKFAHKLTAARAIMGTQRLVPIGIAAVEKAVQAITAPKLSAPAADAHKYTRGMCAVIGGAMPGASILAARSAMHSGAGYVKLLSGDAPVRVPASLVCDNAALEIALSDPRIAAVLIGPGLGRDDIAYDRLDCVFAQTKSLVLDADALHLLRAEHAAPEATRIATPHKGELDALCRTFNVIADGQRDRAQAVARASAMVVVAKGPDTFIAAPDGRMALAPSATSWLSAAGTGDVLAGIIASRLATGSEPFEAACEGVWLHSAAARHCGPAFTADDLAAAIPDAMAQCL